MDSGVMRRLLFIVVAIAAFPAAGSGQERVRADHFVPSRPENVTWGWLLVDKPPVLRIRPGETVRIDTLSHHGSTQEEHPIKFLGGFGVKPDQVLQDVIDFWATRAKRPGGEGRGGHVMTGPIFIEGARPGDMLEVQVLDVELRVPYGFNNAGGGVLGPNYPGTRPGDPAASGSRKLIWTRKVSGRNVVQFADGITFDAAPFMGNMAVAPPDPVPGPPVGAPLQSTRPPGVFGGNMDFRELGAGSKVYLPVFHEGALFYTGDPHVVQGGGEVSGTAIEHSATATFRFVLHKDKKISAPRAETATDYIVMGIDVDLDRAMRLAVQQAVDFLVAEMGMTAGDAFSLTSLAVDFNVAEAVNLTQVIVGKIPKRIFDKEFLQKRSSR
jgi:acetamidase/formamidase